MFSTEIIGNFVPKRELIDTTDTIEQAIRRYVEIAWEDPPGVLLGRTVIIRCTGDGGVRAVGTYHNDPTSPDVVMAFHFPSWDSVRHYRTDLDRPIRFRLERF